jgi:hypothetical protein
LEEFYLNLGIQKGKLVLEDLEFQALDGNFRFRGEMDWPSEQPHFSLEAAMSRLSLARYYRGIGQKESPLEGNLFLKGRFEGEGLKSGEVSEKLTGQGGLSITNGEWHSLNLMGALRAISEFQDLTPKGLRSTPFDDLKADWRYGKGKFDTQDLLLRTEDLWVEGKGNLTLEGTLNSRLEIYLSEFHTDEVLRSWKAPILSEGKQLGPLPFLLLGSLSEPQLKLDERLIEPFLKKVRNRKFSKILHLPFREEGRSSPHNS